MIKEEIFNLLIEEISKKLPVEVADLKDHSNPEDILFDELAINSLGILMLAMDIEKKLSIELDITEFPYNATLDGFADYLYQLQNH